MKRQQRRTAKRKAVEITGIKKIMEQEGLNGKGRENMEEEEIW